jgi:isopropylmalate/homocitrate/citramalate synthase
VIDKYTGKSALNNRLNHIGISVSPKELDTILIEIKSHPEKLNWEDKQLISLTKSMGINS